MIEGLHFGKQIFDLTISPGLVSSQSVSVLAWCSGSLAGLNSKNQPMFHKVRDIVRAEGMSGLARRGIAYAYRLGVRPFSPRVPVRYAGIPICLDMKWSDRFVPASWFHNDISDEPGYETALVAALNETVRPGDSVVVVGGGVGVTAVVAALRAGPSGNIQCFEGSERYVRLAQQTAARNGITNISIHHAIVAKLIGTFDGGIASDLGPVLPPSQLPTCNVLEMDCEGAEVEILREMTIQPRVIVVETHGLYGAPTELVASLLEERGYVVDDRGIAEPRYEELHRRQDVRVLLGTLKA